MRYTTGEETKKNIIESAFYLLANEGYDRMSIDQIMKRVGKTKGSFYVHFKNKEEVLYEVMKIKLNRNISQIKDWVIRELSKDDVNVQDVIKVIMNQVITGSGGNDTVIWATAYYQLFGLAQKDQYVKEWMMNEYRQWESFLTQVIQMGQNLGQIRKDINAGFIANLILGVFQGYELRSTVDSKVNFQEQLAFYQMLYTTETQK